MKAQLSKRLSFLQPAVAGWDRAFLVLWLILALLMIGLAASVEVIYSSDPITHYLPAAQALLDGQGIEAFRDDTYRGPLLPAGVALVSLPLRGDIFRAGLVVGALAYIALVPAIYLTLRGTFDPRLAWFATVAAATTTTLLFNSVAWLGDGLFAALCLWSLHGLMRAQSGRAWAGLGAGLLAGLAFDTRWNGVFILPVAAALAVLNPGRLALRPRWGWLGAFALGWLAAAGPWLAINANLHGSPFYNQLWQVGLHPEIVSPRLPAHPALWDVVVHDPAYFVPRYLWRLAWMGWLDAAALLPRAFILFAPAGALVAAFTLRRSQWPWLLFMGAFWATAVTVHFEARYYLLMLPALAAAPLVFLLWDRLPEVWLGRRIGLRPVVVAGLLLVVAGANYRSVWGGIQTANEMMGVQVTVAEFIRHSQPPAALVAVRHFSGARYFIPHSSGVPVRVLEGPGEYLDPPDAAISHVFVEEGIPERWGGNELPAEIFNPLRVSAPLEAIFFKPDAPRAVLYRVVRGALPWPVVDAVVTSALDETHGAAALLDDDPATGWAPAPGDSAPAITLDLGGPRLVDRLWLLPAPAAAAFPETARLEVSVDGQAWVTVAEALPLPLVERQDPAVVGFEPISARYLRLTGLRLRSTAEGVQFAVNGVRASLNAAEAGDVRLALSEADLSYDAALGVLVFKVENSGNIPGPAAVRLETAAGQGLDLTAPQVPPGGWVSLRVALAPWLPPGDYDLTLRLASPAAPADHTLITAAVPALTSLTALPFDNLLANPGFEGGLAGWRVDAPAHLDGDGPHAGGAALRVDKMDFPDANFFHVGAGSLPLVGQTPYVYGAWIRAEGLGQGVRVVANAGEAGPFWDEPQPPYDQANPYGGTQAWTLRVGVIPPQPAAVPGGLVFLNSDFQQGTFWVDDVFVMPLYTIAAGE